MDQRDREKIRGKNGKICSLQANEQKKSKQKTNSFNVIFCLVIALLKGAKKVEKN